MLNAEDWKPTKYEERRGTWRASRNLQQVGLGSRLITDRCAQAYSRALAEHARGDLLDLGCGHVPLYGCYRDLVEKVTCVDWPNSPHPSPHIDVHADLGQRLPFDDETYDTVVATDVLEHLPYPDVLWTEMARILRPGGTVILGAPFMYWLHERPHDHHRYTEYRLRLFCADHGLSAVTCEPYGGTTDVLADILSKAFNRRGASAMSRAVTWVAERRTSTDPGTAMPLGYVLIARKPVSSP